MTRRKVVVIGHGFTSRLGVVRSVGALGCDVTVIVMTWYGKNGKLVIENRLIAIANISTATSSAMLKTVMA